MEVSEEICNIMVADFISSSSSHSIIIPTTEGHSEEAVAAVECAMEEEAEWMTRKLSQIWIPRKAR